MNIKNQKMRDLLKQLPKQAYGVIVGSWHDSRSERADIISDPIILTIARDTNNGVFQLTSDYNWVFIDGMENSVYATNVLESAVYCLVQGNPVIIGKHDGFTKEIYEFTKTYKFFKIDFINDKYFKLTKDGCNWQDLQNYEH